jgi:hypothetical protein
MSLAQRTRSLWARLGLATTPGDPEEARAFLQRRISFFVGVCFLLWMIIGVSSELAALHMPAVSAKAFSSCASSRSRPNSRLTPPLPALKRLSERRDPLAGE